MKLISIGDIHGRKYWKEIDPTKYDKIIFVGDYVDQYPPMTDVEIESNFLEIIEFKKNNMDKVVLLLGNHDVQYLFWHEGYESSGYRPTMANNLHVIFKHNKDLFQVAFQIENYIWSHAGISEGWFDFNQKDIEMAKNLFNCKDIADTFNHMMWTKNAKLLFQCGKKRGGYYPYGGITWADRVETKDNYLKGYHQIVGHTPIEQITKFGDENGSIRYIDVLNEVYFEEQKRTKGWKSEYEKQNEEQFPGFIFEEKVQSKITKFYEFENEHWV